MGRERFSRLRRAIPAAVAVAALGPVAVAAGGPAWASAGNSVTAPRDGTTAGVISTVAGGVGGPGLGTKVALAGPGSVQFGNGRVYVANLGDVRMIDPATGQLSTLAGTDAPGPPGNGGPATKATIDEAGGPAVDHSGNVVVTDALHQEVRVVAAHSGTFYGQPMQAGHIYAVAGNGTQGFSGDGGPATSAELFQPGSVIVDAAGNLLISDVGNSRIRVVAATTGTFYGQAMTAGDIYTIAGGGSQLGDGGPATSAQLGAGGTALDAAGNLVIADFDNNRIRVVATHTGTFYGQAMTAGDIYTVAGNGKYGDQGNGIPATSAEFRDPEDVAVDAAGNLLIADSFNHQIRLVAASSGTFYGQSMLAGFIYTIAGGGFQKGDGVPATQAKLGYPSGVAVDGNGNVVIAGAQGRRVRVVAARTGTFYGQAMSGGDIYTAAGNGAKLFCGDGWLATRAELDGPLAVAVDRAGNVLISDMYNNRVRLVAASTGTVYGRPVTAGHIYTVAGDGGAGGFTGDGGPATKAAIIPYGITVDAAGNLIIGDVGNNRVRVVAASTGTFYGQPMTIGDIYTVAGDGGAGGFTGDGGPATKAELNGPSGVAVDAAGNLVIADVANNRIRVVAATTGTFYGQAMTAGDIYTVAGNGKKTFSGDGGPATKAALNGPDRVTVDAAGNLVISDSSNRRIRVVAATTGTFYGQPMTAGDIYTVAGNGRKGFSGDGGPATKAALSGPVGVAVDAAGNLLFADAPNNRIRMVAARTGSFYGLAVTAGDIYTVAGDGYGGSSGGFSGDGGPATKAALTDPGGVTVNAAGNLLIADYGNNRIRKVTG